ncbi:MAG: lysophospholipid acyltransferase family protein [Marinosulfonomonas sp.]
MNLRKRIENSKTLIWLFSTIISSYLKLCNSTTRWDAVGIRELEETLRDGPVIVVSWHSSLLMSGLHWPNDVAKIKPLHDTSPAGQLVGGSMRQFGLDPIEMSSKHSTLASSRLILREIKQGASVGIAADGPNGPARKSKPHAIGWARSSGRPIYLYAWSAKSAWRMKTWDKMKFPFPFAQGAFTIVKWDVEIPRGLANEEYTKLGRRLNRSLDRITRETDIRAGYPPEED